MTLNTAQRATIRHLHERTASGRFTVSCFQSPTFNTKSVGDVGYPITLTLDDALNGQPEDRKVIQWCVTHETAQSVVAEVNAYIATLEAVK